MTADDNADAQPVIPQEDPFDPWDILKRQAAEYTGTVAVLDAIDRARSAVHAQHAQEMTALKAELESTPYGKMRRALILRAEAAEAQIVTLRKQFKAHTDAVGAFLTELHAVMVDPCAEGTTSVTEMQALLLAAAVRDRDAAYESQGEITRLSAQLHAKDHDIELLKHGWCVACGDGNHQHCLGGKCDCIHATGSHELANLQRQLADEQLLRRNAEAKFADLIRQIEEKTDAPTTRT